MSRPEQYSRSVTFNLDGHQTRNRSDVSSVFMRQFLELIPNDSHLSGGSTAVSKAIVDLFMVSAVSGSINIDDLSVFWEDDDKGDRVITLKYDWEV